MHSMYACHFVLRSLCKSHMSRIQVSLSQAALHWQLLYQNGNDWLLPFISRHSQRNTLQVHSWHHTCGRGTLMSLLEL